VTEKAASRAAALSELSVSLSQALCPSLSRVC